LDRAILSSDPAWPDFLMESFVEGSSNLAGRGERAGGGRSFQHGAKMAIECPPSGHGRGWGPGGGIRWFYCAEHGLVVGKSGLNVMDRSARRD
jgi:hypothetical protein